MWSGILLCHSLHTSVKVYIGWLMITVTPVTGFPLTTNGHTGLLVSSCIKSAATPVMSIELIKQLITVKQLSD